MKREKGSITLFSLLSLLLITAALFALLEGTRFQELRRFATLQTEMSVESVFANYNTCLWKNYHLLGADSTTMQEILEKTANGRDERGTNLLRFVPQKVDLEEYTRITDGNGSVFVSCVATYMRENFVYESIKEIYSQYESIKQILDSSQMDTSNIEEALEEIEKLGQEENAQSIGTSGNMNKTQERDVKEILETVKHWKEVGILELVLSDTEKVSRAEVDFDTGILERELKTGKNPVEQEVTWTDRILLQQYLQTYLSFFSEEKENRALSYELEYLLGKTSSDIENLKRTVTKLLVVREAANFLYLISNAKRVAQTEAMALLFVGASANPILVEAVKIGLITAWAFVESVFDVRALLAGKRIALLKSEDTWTVDLDDIAKVSSEFGMAKECTWGLTYENYLGLLFMLEDEQNLAMYTMNLQEATIRKNDRNDFFCMDSLIVQANITITYSYEPVFPFLRVIDAEERWKHILLGKANYGYY